MTFVAVITGASSGIGEATARLLAERQPDAKIVLVARRRDRIDAVAAELNAGAASQRAYPYAADLTDADALAGLTDFLESGFGHLNLLVNNAGARWSQPFSEGGYVNVAQTMAINFEAQVRLTESLLPLVRRGASAASTAPAPSMAPAADPAPDQVPPAVHQAEPGEPRGGEDGAKPSPAAAIVNVASTAARVSRPGTGAYSASKAALVGWSDSLYHELAPEGIHVGLVNPGFIATEGFPADELRSHPVKRLIVSTPEKAAAAVLAAGPGGKAEVFVPGYYWVFAVARILAPGVIRKLIGGGGFNTGTALDAQAGERSSS